MNKSLGGDKNVPYRGQVILMNICELCNAVIKLFQKNFFGPNAFTRLLKAADFYLELYFVDFVHL